MIELSPKAQFLGQPERVKAFSELIVQPVMREAITVVMAQLAWSNADHSQLEGAQFAIKLLASLADPISKIEPIPQKTLTPI
jgi:hypothetical protein